MEEVGPNCQCGCIIHLLKSKPRRMLASSSQACVGLENAFWTIQVESDKRECYRGVVMKSIFSLFSGFNEQVEEGYQIKFDLDYFMLPCPTQMIRIRDGKNAWMSELIGEFSGRGALDGNGHVASSGNLVLIDFHMNDSQIVGNICYAGFIGHVELIGKY